MIPLLAKSNGRPSNTYRQVRGQFSRHSLLMLILHGALMGGCFLINGSVTAQTRDHLTDQETELVRFYQELDKRIDVFIKAIDRRFAIINGMAPPPSKKLLKDEPEWG